MSTTELSRSLSIDTLSSHDGVSYTESQTTTIGTPKGYMRKVVDIEGKKFDIDELIRGLEYLKGPPGREEEE